MGAFLQHVGTFFLGAAAVVLLLLSLLASKDREAGILEVILIVGIAAVPGALAVMAFMTANQMLA